MRFSIVAKAFGQLAAQAGFVAPGFRSPPSSRQTDRGYAKHGSGSVVAVRIKDRPFEAVIADMIEGVIVCNGSQALDPVSYVISCGKQRYMPGLVLLLN